MDQCYQCGDLCIRAEMVECDLCRNSVCEKCSMAHFLEHERDGDFEQYGRGEAFYEEGDLDISEIPDED